MTDIYDLGPHTAAVLTNNGIRTVEQYLAIPHFRRRKLRGMTPLMSLEIDRKLRDYHPRRDPPKVEVAEQMSIFDYMGDMT